MFDEPRIVAIIDDDPAVRESLKSLLEAVGYPVAAYATADAFLQDDAVRPSCIILDQHMPGMSGLQLLARLRAGGSGLPVLMVTGMPSLAIIAEARRLGIEKVLEKPVYEEDILTFVSAC
jgi:FixJ family two-component response regulator